MGVRGLQTLLKNNEFYLSDKISFNNSKLIIDGNNLMCQLYLRSALDRSSPNYRNDIYGGDLVEYYNIASKFFKTLSECQISPIVIFDGSVIGEISSPDFVALRERETYKKGLEKFKRIQNQTEVPHDEDLNMPQTLNIIFRCVLKEFKIDRVQAAHDADALIARYANDYNCPVLTNDSDFIIFELKNGFILLDSFKHQNPVRDSAGNLSITCSLFSQEKMLKNLPGLEPGKLPLLSVILGNDYVEPETLNRVLKSICNGHYNGFLSATTFNHKRIANLLTWLRRKSLQEAIDCILDLVHPIHQPKLERLLELFMRNYRIEETDNFDNELNAIYDPHQKLPVDDSHPTRYLKRQMQTNDLGSMALDMIFHNTHYNYTIVDDFSLSSSGRAKIRAYSLMLALLKPHTYTGLATGIREIMSEQDSFLIYDRLKNEYSKMTIRPMETLEGFGSLDHLDCRSMIKLGPQEKAAILRACFRFTQEDYDRFDECVSKVFCGVFAKELVICLLLIKYISVECEQPPDRHFVGAILSTFFYYAALAGSLKETELDVADSVILELKPHAIMLNHCSYGSADYSLYRRCMHFISQLQCAYKGYIALNALLGHPYHVANQGLFGNYVLVFRLTKLFRLDRLQFESVYKDLPIFLDFSDTVYELLGC